MKTVFIIIFLLLFCGCGHKEDVCIVTGNLDLDSTKIGVIIGISAPDRETLVNYLKDWIETFGGEEWDNALEITLQDDFKNTKATYSIKTPEDVPYSSVHYKDNWWFIRYENNKGYMPITRGKIAEKEKEE